MSAPLDPRPIRFANLATALRVGVARFRLVPGLSVGFSALFAAIGLGLFFLLEANQIAPMSIALAGGFMLVGPALLVGFFTVADALNAGRPPSLGALAAGFRRAPWGLWVLALVCGLLFMIWITDAGTIYAFVIGQDPVGFLELLPPIENVRNFLLFSSIMGLALAFVIFAVSAFSVPLLYYRRAELIPAVVASIRAVFGSFSVMMAWAMVLVALVMSASWFLPLLPLTLPVAAYASHALYQAVFPEQ